MKILKYLFGFVALLISALAVILIIDNLRTSYLDIDEESGFANNTYLIKNVNVIPMNMDTVLMDKSVYIKNGIIEQIADNIELNNVEVLDAQNKFLLPGLVDMHVHVWDKYELGLYLANGVTTIRNMWGIPWHLKLKEEIANNVIIAPLFFTSTPKLAGPNYPGDDNIQLQSTEDATKRIRSYKEQGYDFIKTYNGLTKELFDTVIKLAKEWDFEIAAHPSSEVPYSYHFNSQIVTIEHAEDIVQQPLNYKLDTAKLDEVVNLYANHPTHSLCPTLISYHNIYKMLTDEHILSNEQMNMINPLIRMVDSEAQVNRWQSTKGYDPGIVGKIEAQHNFHLLAIKKLADAGVNIICGTDAGIGITYPGYSIHEELGFYKKAGLSNYQVLKTATVNPSKTHGFLSNLGSIEAGKSANLLIVKDNPLTKLTTLKSPEIVFIQGRRIEKNQLETFKQSALDRSNLITTIFKYVKYLLVEK